MEFTALELLLGGGFITLISSLATSGFMNSRFVTRKEFDEKFDRLASLEKRVKNNNAIIYGMLRMVVMHMDNLSTEKKNEILNLKLDKGE